MEKGNIAIIPARGGSQRIPGKNIRSFNGKPIIAYSIQNALESDLFAEVIVSTDSNEIAHIALDYGAKVPFLRSAKNSDSKATTSDAIREVIDNYIQTGNDFEVGCCLYPTAVFASSEVLRMAYNRLIATKVSSVFPVLEFSHPIWRGITIDKEKTSFIWPENINARTQDLKTVYHDAGQFYWFNKNDFLRTGSLINSDSEIIVLSADRVHDIDNESDWKIAEIKYSLINAE